MAVAELCFAERHERPGIDRVQQFLVIQGNTRDVDRPKPFFDLGFGAGAFVHQKRCVEDFGLFVGGEAAEVLLHAVFVFDGELVGDIASETGDPLLAVQNFQFVAADFVEINQSQWVALQQRLDHRDIAFAVGVDIVALVFGLDGEPAGKSEQAFAFDFVIDKAVADFFDRVLLERCFHVMPCA